MSAINWKPNCGVWASAPHRDGPTIRRPRAKWSVSIALSPKSWRRVQELAARGVALRQEDCATAPAAYAPALHSYTWERPHEALAMQVPGALYRPTPRVRPACLPEHELPESAVKRKVSSEGKINYRGRVARVGKGLRGQTVEIREESAEEQIATVFFAGVKVATIPNPRPKV